MMLQLKDGALVCGNKYTNAIMEAAQIIYARHSWPVTITSGRDSHEGGYHPQDRALDIRCWMIPEPQRDAVATEFRQALPKFYDVVYEPQVEKDGQVVKGAHFHIEADAKKEKAHGV